MTRMSQKGSVLIGKNDWKTYVMGRMVPFGTLDKLLTVAVKI
jgi:hypothetical protein